MKRGVSPVIAAVILIVITAVLGAIIFSSSNEFIAQLSPPADCSSVSFNAGLYLENNQIIIEVDNIGNADIDGFDIQSDNEAQGSSNRQTIDLQVLKGQSASQNLQLEEIDLSSKLTLIPRVKNAKNEVAVCADVFGRQVTVSEVAESSQPQQKTQ